MKPVVIVATEMLQYYGKSTQMYTIYSYFYRVYVFNVFSTNICMQSVDTGSVV